MLEFLRKKVTLGKVILLGVAASLVAWHFGIGVQSMGDASDPNTVAMVGDSAISEIEWRRAYRNLDQRYRSMFGEQYETFAVQLQPRRQALEQLIERELVLREAERLGIEATREEIKREIVEQFTDEQGRFLGAEAMDRVLARSGYSRTDFEEAVASDIVYRKLRQSIETAVVVDQTRLREVYLERNNALSAEYISLDPQREQPADEPSDTQLTQWFDQHRDDYAYTRRQAQLVRLTASTYADQVQLSPEQLREYYDTQQRYNRFGEQRRARHILIRVEPEADEQAREAARSEAERLLAELRGGGDFEALAKQHSDDPGSAAKGGDLGFFARGRMVPEFDQAVFSAQPGDLVGPVQTSFGFHLIRLEEVRPARSFEQAESELREELASREALQLAREAALELIEAAGEQGLAEAAVAAGLAATSSQPVRRDDSELGVEWIPERRASALVSSLFTLSQPGEVYSSPLAVEDSYVVMALEGEQGPFQPELEEVRAQVAADLKLERGRERVSEKLATAQQQLAEGNSFGEAAEAISAPVQTADSLKPGQGLPGVPESAALIDRAFDAAPDTVLGPEELGGRHVLLRVKSKFEFDEQRFEQEKQALADSLRQQQATTLWSSLVRGLRQRLESRGELRVLRSADFFAEQRQS